MTLGITITKLKKRNPMKIIFGNGIQDGRGKLNGTVASKNRYGSYFRTKVSPVNRSTARQSFIRALFSSFSSNWSQLLSETERSQWTAFASFHAFTNVFGQKRFLDGKASYIGVNTAAVNAGFSDSNTPPADTTTGEIGEATLTATVAAGGTLSVATNENNVPGTATINFYATPVIPAGRNFVKSELRYIGTILSGASPYDIKTLWAAKYGTFPTVAGGKIIIAAQICTDAGWLSLPTSAAALVS